MKPLNRSDSRGNTAVPSLEVCRTCWLWYRRVTHPKNTEVVKQLDVGLGEASGTVCGIFSLEPHRSVLGLQRDGKRAAQVQSRICFPGCTGNLGL